MNKMRIEFGIATALYPKMENEDYRGGGGEGALDQPHDTLWYLNKIITENQGNILTFWGYLSRRQQNMPRIWDDGRLFLEWCGLFQQNGLKLLVIYPNENCLSKAVINSVCKALGADFLGANVGEWNNKWFSSKAGYANGINRVFQNLTAAKTALINEHYRTEIERIKAMGYPAVYTTGGHALADYEFEAGIDFVLHEGCACSYALSEMRGGWKKWQTKGFGLYLNHDWYTKNIPYSVPQKYALLKVALYQSWIGGAFITALESGNLWTEGGVHTLGSSKNYPYEHEYCRNYRKVMREFKIFTDNHPRSARTPDVKVCFARGNLDGFAGRWVNRNDRFFTQHECVFGINGTAMQDGNYLYGDPEYGWDIYNKTVAPVNPDALAPYRNHWLCGTPFGQTDIVGMDDGVSSDLLASYSIIIFCGWNTMTSAIYGKLMNYVAQGGVLLMALPQCSTREDREYWNYEAGDLINNGNLSELFGVKIQGRKQFMTSAVKGDEPLDEFYGFYDYDVVQHSRKSPQLISDFMAGVLIADVELDETSSPIICQRIGSEYAPQCGAPLVVEKKYGLGRAFLTLAWDYPGARGLKDLYTYLIKNLLHACRDRRCYITERNGNITGDHCQNIFYALYPEEMCAINSDCQNSRMFDVHIDGRTMSLTLKPAECITIPCKEMNE